MILVQNVGNGTYGPFFWEGGLTEVSISGTGITNCAVQWTDASGYQDYPVSGLNLGSQQMRQVNLPPGNYTLLALAATSATVVFTRIPT